MAKKIPDEIKREAIRLRVRERLGIGAIQKQTGLSRGTLSALLRKYPLSDEEIKARRRTSIGLYNAKRLTYRNSIERSKYALMVEGQKLSHGQKGKIAEAAVLMRLALLGYDAWKSGFEGNRVDWLVTRPNAKRYVRIQVKSAYYGKAGRPVFDPTNRQGKARGRITDEHCDFVVAYDLETDTAYVIPIEQASLHLKKSCDAEYAEAWHLLNL